MGRGKYYSVDYRSCEDFNAFLLLFDEFDLYIEKEIGYDFSFLMQNE